MVQISKTCNNVRPAIRILGDTLEEVRNWMYFFYNRGAIQYFGDVDWDKEEIEETMNGFVYQFSCPIDNLIRAFELSSPAQCPVMRKKYALDRIAAMPSYVQLSRFAGAVGQVFRDPYLDGMKQRHENHA